MEVQIGEIDGELKRFTKVSVLVVTSLSYCYYVSAKIPRGLPRLLSVLPVIYLFLILPLEHASVHLSFFASLCLAWLGNFRLLLFSFDKGPLIPRPPKLLHFICMACLPIKVVDKQEHTTENLENEKPSTEDLSEGISNSTLFRTTSLVFKAAVLSLLFYTYNYKHYFHKNVVLAFNFIHYFFAIEILLVLSGIPARSILKFEPQFREPWISTSVQEFWGRRWNRTVSHVLRSTVYDPVRSISVGIIGSRWAFLPAVFLTFLVSGLMHELMHYHVTRMPPTWDVTWFFILQGICVDLDITMKKKEVMGGKFKLHPAISVPLVWGFLMVTSIWLLLPKLMGIGVDDIAARECLLLAGFLMGMTFMPPLKKK